MLKKFKGQKLKQFLNSFSDIGTVIDHSILEVTKESYTIFTTLKDSGTGELRLFIETGDFKDNDYYAREAVSLPLVALKHLKAINTEALEVLYGKI